MSYKEYDSLKGYFLVANKTLNHSYFSEAVVLVIEHDHLGAFGLVLNKIDRQKKALSSLLNSTTSRSMNVTLYEGGPVGEQSIYILHNDSTIPEPGTEILPGIFLGSSNGLFEYLLEGISSFNLYRGYSGWSAGQLEKEIQTKGWIVLPYSDDIIFHPKPEDIWRETLNLSGGLYSYFAEKVRDPLLN